MIIAGILKLKDLCLGIIFDEQQPCLHTTMATSHSRNEMLWI